MARKGIDNKPMVNGVEVSFAHLVLIVNGIRIFGVNSLNYQKSQEKSNEHGAGRNPQGRGYGPVNFQGSIELSEKAAQRLRQQAPGGDILDMPPFTVIAQYVNGEIAYNDRLMYVEFDEYGVSGSVGDTRLTRSNPIIIGDIKWGRAPIV